MEKFGYVYMFIYKNRYYIGMRGKSYFDEKYYGSGVMWKKIISNANKKDIIRIVLKWCDNEKDLHDSETYYIKKYKSLLTDGNGGCNIAEGGYNYPFRGKTKEEISDIFKESAIIHSERQQGENNSFYGKKHSEETKKKISENTKKTLNNPEVKKKLSIASSGKNNPMYGRPKNEKTINAIKEANSKKVIIDKIVYSSYTEAEKILGINRKTIRRRINSEKWKNYELYEVVQ